MTLQQEIAAAIDADPRSVAKIARDADMNASTLYALKNGADSRLSILVKVTDTLGCEVRLVNGPPASICED